MKVVDETWQASRGAVVFGRSWLPDEEPRAALILIHGLGEHSGRYWHVAEHFARAGYLVQSMDLRGHGKTPGQRGHVPSIAIILEDIDLLLEKVAHAYPGLECFLYGHSLGALLAVNYALRYLRPLTGVVATGLATSTPLMDQTTKITLARVLGSILPRITLATGVDPNTICRDPQVVQAYIADSLVHDRSSLGLGKGMIDMVDFIKAHAQEFKHPLLLCHGTRDQLAYPQGSQEFARLVPRNVTLKLWEGLFHEVHNEPEKELVLEYIRGWMDQQLILQGGEKHSSNINPPPEFVAGQSE
ncbi:MAG TPA: lysophospholipase [Anaerolineales bacterium]|nr:lysophospholipase [Anaerolineales bacterium]